MEASDKHNKSHDTSSSGQLQEPQKPSRPRKHRGKKAESSGSAEAMTGDNHAAEFGNAGEWPVDPKHDSAGAPVRKAPEPVNAEEKKEGKKRRKKSKEKETKDQEGKQVKKLLQPSSSSGKSERAAEKGPKIKDRKVESKDNKQPEKVPSIEDCTTKRNLHMIKTERAGGHTEDDEEAIIAKEEKKIKKRKGKKRSKKRSKNKKSGEKIEGEEAKQPPKFKKKKEVELSSIHIDKEPPARPLVERTPIKTEAGGHPTVEREPLYNIIPNYANIPETTLMRQLKPPVDPNRNPFVPSSTVIPDDRTVTITEPSQGDKKTTTEKENKKELQQISTAQEWSVVTEKESNMTKFKRRVRNPPGCLWLVAGALVILIIILIVLSADLYSRNVALAEEVTELKKTVTELKNSGKSPSA